MSIYNAPTKDIQFLLHDLMNISARPRRPAFLIANSTTHSVTFLFSKKQLSPWLRAEELGVHPRMPSLGRQPTLRRQALSAQVTARRQHPIPSIDKPRLSS